MKINPSRGISRTIKGVKDGQKIMLVDDHPVIRNGLAQLIDQEPDLKVCGQFEDSTHALEAVAALQPDLAIVDLSLKGSSGLELVKNIKSAHPGVLILVLSMHDESLYAERAIRAGASGYIMKQESADRVLGAIRKVLNGGIHLSEGMNSKFMHRLKTRKSAAGGSLMERLSNREMEVFGLIGEGRGTRQIAEHLRLSIKTVESHRAHLKEKLSLKNATELVHLAVQMQEE
ncbi:MAG TPA: response regulator transcription factor [Candidatus Baltobacteraceae bacterium]|jgi:DNA-binding NarL/FixJ family response regulator|nr:response regulator transcription factor [Candidatus Baltobacteraceae bacterium]